MKIILIIYILVINVYSQLLLVKNNIYKCPKLLKENK